MGETHVESRSSARAQVRRRGRDLRPPAGALPRDDHAAGRGRGQAQEAERRPRPVRRLLARAWSRCRAAAGSSSWTRSSAASSRGQFIPAVEKGVVEAMQHGGVAGYPVVDVRVTLYDGKHHAVDSSEMAFKIAGSLGFKDAIAKAGPVLLEPVMRARGDRARASTWATSWATSTPAAAHPARHGDARRRRGRIRAEVPMSEMLSYAPDLRVDDRRPRRLHDGVRPLRAGAGAPRREGGGSSGGLNDDPHTPAWNCGIALRHARRAARRRR